MPQEVPKSLVGIVLVRDEAKPFPKLFANKPIRLRKARAACSRFHAVVILLLF